MPVCGGDGGSNGTGAERYHREGRARKDRAALIPDNARHRPRAKLGANNDRQRNHREDQDDDLSSAPATHSVSAPETVLSVRIAHQVDSIRLVVIRRNDSAGVRLHHEPHALSGAQAK